MINDYPIQQRKSQPFMIFRYICYALISYCLFLAVPEILDASAKWHTNKSDSELFFRVVANSNLDADQQLKKEMVEDLRPLFSKFYTEQLTASELKAYVAKSYPQYNVTTQIGSHLIPPKVSNGTFYPQNFYESVVVTIGKGRGDNWFCSAFPNVCDRPEEEKREKPRFAIWEWLKRKWG